MRLMILNLALLSLFLQGCASTAPPADVISPEMGMVYGNVQVPGDEVVEIEFREYGKFYIPPFIIPPRVLIYSNGNFASENLTPGKYYISRIVGKQTKYTLVKDERTAYQWIIDVEPGSVNYIGSYHITNIHPGLFTKGDFDIRPIREPSERKILKHMYEVTRGTGWQARIDKRLKELR